MPVLRGSRKHGSADSIPGSASEAGGHISLKGYSNVNFSMSSDISTPVEDTNNTKDRTLPVNKVGFSSCVFVKWLSALIWKMYRNRAMPVSEHDLWECPDEEGMRVNTKSMINLWREELQTNGKETASFMKVWWRFIRKRHYVTLLMLTLSALASLVSSAFLVNQILVYLESKENNLALGLGLTVSVLVCEVIRAVSLVAAMLFSCQTGMRFRSGFMGIIYNKLLKMRSVRGKTNSEIINGFTVDSNRAFYVTMMITYIWLAPIFVIMATVYCYILIGYWSFVAIGTFVFCYCVQMNLGRFISPLRSKCVPYTDARVRKMGEILNSIKVIKMYAWEKPFADSVNEVRKSEQKYQMYLTFLYTSIGSVIAITPIIAYVITFTLYTAFGNVLTASTAFAVIGTMNFIRTIVVTTPMALRLFGEVKVSFQRLKVALLKHGGIKCLGKNGLIVMESDQSVPPNDLPSVFQAILKCLGAEPEPVSWTLSKSYDGKFELRIRNFPATKQTDKCPDVLNVKEVETKRSSSTKTTGKKQKSPFRLRRDRVRCRIWRRKQRAARRDTVSVEPESDHQDHSTCDQDSGKPQDPSETQTVNSGKEVAEPVKETVSGKGSVTDCPASVDSETSVDSTNNLPDDPYIADRIEFHNSLERAWAAGKTLSVCIKCRATEGTLKACSRCKAIKYCGAQCQRQDWEQHKLVCEVLKDYMEQGQIGRDPNTGELMPCESY